MADRETVITHLMIIHTWAEFALERDLQFFTAKHLEDITQWTDDALKLLKEQEADKNKYEYKYDHTDCIWYHDGRGRCPSTCSQYRDGWNDAMNFIYKNGAGYRPYKRR